MFGLGLPELIVIFVIALVVFGPKKLPDLGKSIGRAMAEFKKAQQEFQESVQSEMREVEKKTNLEEFKHLGSINPQPAKNAEPGTSSTPMTAEQKPESAPEQQKDAVKGEETKANG